ncbi:DUF3592 domain-containing protein [Ignatzschineria sp. LJL83]
MGNLLGSFFGIIYLGALILGFFSGFYALFEGTNILITQILQQLSSQEVLGMIIDADNSPNMSEAMVRFTDLAGETHEFFYRASFNGTVFTVGETVPVYYQPDMNPALSATLNNKGAYGAVAFLYFYGFAVSAFGIYVCRSVYKAYQKERGIKKLQTEGKFVSAKITAIIPKGERISLKAEYQPLLSNKVYDYISDPIPFDDDDISRLIGATVQVKILPKKPKFYQFDDRSLEAIVLRK